MKIRKRSIKAAFCYFADDLNAQNYAKILQALMDSLYKDLEGEKIGDVEVHIGDKIEKMIDETITDGAYKFTVGFFPPDYLKQARLEVISRPDSRGKFYCRIKYDDGSMDEFYIPMSGSRKALEDKIEEIAESINGDITSSRKVRCSTKRRAVKAATASDDTVYVIFRKVYDPDKKTWSPIAFWYSTGNSMTYGKLYFIEENYSGYGGDPVYYSDECDISYYNGSKKLLPTDEGYDSLKEYTYDWLSDHGDGNGGFSNIVERQRIDYNLVTDLWHRGVRGVDSSTVSCSTKTARIKKAVKASMAVKAAWSSNDAHMSMFDVIFKKKNQYINEWQSESSGEPISSWDAVFDNVVDEFWLYCDDEASADESGKTVSDRFNDGEITAEDVDAEFDGWVMWIDLNDFDYGVDASKRLPKRAKSVKAARSVTINYLNFNELNDEQKEQAIEKFLENGTAYEWYSEDMMFWYEENLKELADEYSNKYGLTIHEDKLYWQSNSQGPYPEWDLSNVFGDIDEESYQIKFYGKGTDVEVDGSIYSQGEDGEWYFDEEFDETNAPEAAKPKIEAAQRFIDEVWSRVEDVCRDYPDEEWCYETLEANDYEFQVDDDGNVVKMA